MDATRSQMLDVLIAGLKSRHGCTEESAPGIAELMLTEFVRRARSCGQGRGMCSACGSSLVADPVTLHGRDH